MNDGDKFCWGIFLNEVVSSFNDMMREASSTWNLRLKSKMGTRFEGNRIF
jgi:hypothetical protein